MKEEQMDLGSSIQHDLRREFHNMLGILKIIKSEQVIEDDELKSMIDLCLEREANVTVKFDELTTLLESKND